MESVFKGNYRKGTREMKNFDIEVFVKDLDKLSNDMQQHGRIDILVTTASWVIQQQQEEIETLKLQLHTTLTNRNLRTYDGKHT